MAAELEETVPALDDDEEEDEENEGSSSSAPDKKRASRRGGGGGGGGATTKKKNKKKNQPGKYSQLVVDTIRKLGERNGSSLAKIYNEAKKVSWFDQQNGRTYLKYSVKALVQNDTLVQVKGIGANGSFKLNRKKLEGGGGSEKPAPAKRAAAVAPRKTKAKAAKKDNKAKSKKKKEKKGAKRSLPKVPKGRKA
ncbi:histone H1x-like [Microcaecilia unicolor]|uniref:Histone H1x-like n=1 Tax=Microcaecilia unicolor TaxID=1415580 RepID=A0A6P7YFG6_9AMPH|nr:histone H1x-like [Microcaecilia unicolor]